MVVRCSEIHWERVFDGHAPLESQLDQARWCVRALEELIALRDKGAIEFVTCEFLPHVTHWVVYDEEAYNEAKRRTGLPHAAPFPGGERSEDE